MKQLFIRVLSIILVLVSLVLVVKPVLADVGTLSGKVVTGPTKAGVGNIWIKWTGTRSAFDLTNEKSRQSIEFEKLWPHDGEGVGIRFAKTDDQGDFRFVSYAFLNQYDASDDERGLQKLSNVNRRVQQYLTWIKPDQPDVLPDNTAYQHYLNLISQYNYNLTDWIPNESDSGDFNRTRNIITAINQADQYRPQGNGWVRISNRTSFNGGFQCDSPPVISAIKPANFRGFFSNNDRSFHDWTNGWTPIVINDPPIEFTVTGPVGYHDGNGQSVNNYPGNQSRNAPAISCQINGWSRLPNSSNPLRINIYEGDASGKKTLVNSQPITANLNRPDLGGSFGFDYPLPDKYKDGAERYFYTYAVDPADGSEVPLSNSPRILSCGSAPAPTNPPVATNPPTPTNPPVAIPPTNRPVAPPTNPPVTPPPLVAPPAPIVDIWTQSGVNVVGLNSQGGIIQLEPAQNVSLNWTSANSTTCVASGN